MDSDQPSGFQDPDAAKAYLTSLSSHVFRIGDTTKLHPDFAVNLANAISQARAAGLPVNIQSGYRTPADHPSSYDVGGLSLHDKGGAADIGGLGYPGSPQAQQWAKIAAANNIYNPYGIGNASEFSHWQMTPWKLEDRPDVQANVASAKGDMTKIWNAVSPVSEGALAYMPDQNPKSPASDGISFTLLNPPSGKKRQASGPAQSSADFLKSLNVPAPAGSAPVPASPPAPSASPAPAVAAGAPDQSSADFLKSLNVPAPTAAPGASITGRIDVPAPATAQPSAPIKGAGAAPSQATSALGSTVGGFPIIGPYVLGGAQRVAAGIDSMVYGTPYASTLSAIQDYDQRSREAYPKTALAGSVAGSVIGTAPLMAAAPAAFGATRAPIAINALRGAGSGALLGGADAASRSYANGSTDPYTIGADAARGAGFGAVFGGGGAALGTALGNAAVGISNVVSRTTPAARNVAGILSDIGMSPTGARFALSRMGPSSTLADIDPALTTEATGLARTGGAPTSILKGAMAARAAGADERMNDSVTRNLGPRPDLTAEEQAIKDAASKEAGPYYEIARANPVAVDATPVLHNIDAQIPEASGSIRGLLNTVKGYLTDNVLTAKNPLGMTVPKGTSSGLLGVRQALDDLMYNKDTGEIKLGPNAMRIAGGLRSQIDDIVKDDPFIAAGDQAFSEHMQRLRALNSGTEIFKPATRIEDLERTVASSTPEQLASMRTGALSAVHDALDNSRGGDVSAARSLLAKATANRAKLDALFPQSGQVLDDLDHALTMRATEQRVSQNSVTAEAQAVQQKYAPAQGSSLSSVVPALVGEAAGGGAGAAGAALLSQFWHGLRHELGDAAMKRLMVGTSRGLAASGPEQDSFMGEVERAYRTNGVTGALSGGAGGLSALLGQGSGQPLRRALAGQ